VCTAIRTVPDVLSRSCAWMWRFVRFSTRSSVPLGARGTRRPLIYLASTSFRAKAPTVKYILFYIIRRGRLGTPVLIYICNVIYILCKCVSEYHNFYFLFILFFIFCIPYVKTTPAMQIEYEIYGHTCCKHIGREKVILRLRCIRQGFEALFRL